MNTDKVTRFEIIDYRKSIEEFPPSYFFSLNESMSVELALQDGGRTLKVFLDDRKEGE